MAADLKLTESVSQCNIKCLGTSSLEKPIRNLIEMNFTRCLSCSHKQRRETIWDEITL